MNVGLLLNILRNELDDNGIVPLWTDRELAGHIQEGQVKFCRDTRIFKDSFTVGEVLASAVITLAGTSGQVDSVKVNGITVTSAAVPFNATLAQTATDLAANINAFMLTAGYIASGNPVYAADASAGGGTLTLTAVAGTGANPNGYAVIVAASGGNLVGTAPSLSGGTSICQIYLLAGVSAYAIDPRVFVVDILEQHGGRWPLEKKTLGWMNRMVPGWRNTTPATPRMMITDAAPHTVIVWPTPDINYTYDATVYRKPLNSVFDTSGNVITDLELELDDEYLEGVKYWAKRCAYLKNDSETLHPELATYFENQYGMFVENTKRKLIFAGQS